MTTTISNTARTTFRFFRRYRMEVATLLAVSGAAACAVNDHSAPESVAHTKSAIITSAQGVAVAQKAINYAVPAAVAFTQQPTHCLSCHRQPDVLISASTAASLLPDIVLDTSTTTGTGFIANLVTGNQQPDGRWDDSGSTTSMSGESLWALAGYARAGGELNVLPSIKAGLLWAVPKSSPITFPSDGGPFAGAQRSYLNNDFTGAPQMFDWYLPTTQTVFASKVLLDLDTTLGAGDVATLSAQQVSYTDALEGVTMRALTTSTVQQLSLASIAMAESGRARSANAQAIGAEIMNRQTPSQGWGDAHTPGGDPSLTGVNNLTTGQAMYALCRLGLRPRVVPAVGAGLDWLVSQQQDDGSWPVGAHEPSVSTSWALLAVACASDTRGTAAFSPQTGNGSPGAPVAETLTTTLNVTNSAADARMTSIVITGGPPGTVITVTPSTLSIDGDATAPITVTMKLPKGLSPSVSYPFNAAIAFEANGDSAASTASAKYTAAIGEAADPLLAATTTTLQSPPAQVQVGSTVSLSALVKDADGDAVTGGSVEYSLDGAPFVTVTSNASLFPTTWSVPPMPLGNHTLHVAFLGDVPGGFTASSTDQIIDVEQPPPPPPTVAGLPDGSTSSTGAYSLTGTGTPGDTVAILANGTVVRTATIGPDGTWNASFSLSPGAYVITAVETGPGGPSSPTTSHVTVLPGAPVVAGPASGTTFTGMVTTVSGTGTPGATITVTRNGIVVGTTTAAGDGSYSVGVDLVDGPNPLEISQTVNGQTSNLSGVTYNKTPAAPSIVSPAPGTGPQKSGAVTVSGLAVAGSTVILLDNGKVVGSAVAGPDGSYSISATLPDGDHSLSTTASVGGVASAPSTPVSLKIVLSKPFFPASPVDLVAYAPESRGVAVDWPAVAAYDALDGQLATTCLPAAKSIFPVGTTTVICSAGDSLGNSVQTHFAVKVILQALPTFTLPAAKDLVIKTMLSTGANVSFDVSALDAEQKPLAAVCTPASGSFFPMGTTKVSCVATDTLAQTSAAASFDVTVIPSPYGDSVSGGGCSVTRGSSSSNYGSLGLLGLVLVAARRLRRRGDAT